jgi:hypothetical protein
VVSVILSVVSRSYTVLNKDLKKYIPAVCGTWALSCQSYCFFTAHKADAEYQGDWLPYLSVGRSWRRFGVTLLPVSDACCVFSQSKITLSTRCLLPSQFVIYSHPPG